MISTAMANRIELWPTARLVPYGRNARNHSQHQIDLIANSISRFGFVCPILIDREGGIVAGHGRFFAAQKLELEVVPVVIIDHLSEAEIRAYAIVDNQLALASDWDEERLRAELASLQNENIQLDLLGFADEELAQLLATQSLANGLADVDAVPELPETPISLVGDLWVLGNHKLLVGDGTNQSDVQRLMAGAAADLLIIDPPYNCDYQGYTEQHLKMVGDKMSEENFKQFLGAAFRSCRSVMKSDGSLYVFHPSSWQREFQDALEAAGFEIRCQLIWAKNTFAWGFGRYKYQHEPLFFCHVSGEKDRWFGDRSQSTLWEIAKPSANRLHPTMKPVELIERALLNSSQAGDVVVDLFAGAGATLIGCEQQGRKAHLIEIDPKYVDCIVQRWQDFSGKKAILENGGAGQGISETKSLKSGRSKSWEITNFTARIVRDLILDDGEHPARQFGIAAKVNGKTISFDLSVAEFTRMNWVLNKLGPQAIIYPGQQQHARAAIQALSGPIEQARIFSHLGWRKCGAQWVYLHAAGAMSADGPVSGVEVSLLPALRSYRFQSIEVPATQARAVRASLHFLSLAPDRISLPLLACTYRAVLGSVDFSIFLVGSTGVFKTALAALCQQHFGATMDARHLPSSFASTPSALEAPAFYAKDALLVVDDFAPSKRNGDSELQSVAERLFRAVGNRQGRSRGNFESPTPKPPRALVLATGEEVPQGKSIRARMLIVEARAGDIDRARLSECQRYGEEGYFAASMSAFLRWIAKRYEEIQGRLRTRVLEIRSNADPNPVHARLPSAIAELEVGWEIFLDFAVEMGAIDSIEKENLEIRGRTALRTLGTLQTKYQTNGDPASHFIALLQAALVCGQVHVADRLGKAPKDAPSWGWRRRSPRGKWVPQGTRIGWIVGSDLFLDPATSYQVAQNASGTQRFPVSEQALRHQLRERGFLVSTDKGRGMVQVRRNLGGTARQVLHLKTRTLGVEGELNPTKD